MHIRPYNSRDREYIRAILDASRTFTAEEVAVALEVIDDAVSRPQSDDYTICCAENDRGNVVGYICFGPIPMTDRCYDLYWICVDRERKKKGIGSSLILAMESDLMKRGARHATSIRHQPPPMTKHARFMRDTRTAWYPCLLISIARETIRSSTARFSKR